jgi:hypothetical protein
LPLTERGSDGLEPSGSRPSIAIGARDVGTGMVRYD